MQWQADEPHYVAEQTATLAVLEADPGSLREAALQRWVREADEAGCRTWHLRCEPIAGGIWAGLAHLIESSIAEIDEAVPNLVAAHGYEISLVLPRYRNSLEVSRPLTDTAPPGERTRNYPVDRAYRSLNGLIDLLSEWHDAGDHRPWAIACDDFDRANGLVRRFFTELVRRRGAQLDLRILVAGAPGQGDALAAGFGPVVTSRFRPGWHTSPSPTAPADPRAMALRAAELERQIEDDPLIEDEVLPELIDCWLHSTEAERALRWQVVAINTWNHYGLYEASLQYTASVEANLDRIRLEDPNLYFAAVNSLFFCWVPLGQVERARRVLEEALQLLDRSSLPHVYYLIAMLHVRFLSTKDFERADQYLQRGLDLLPELDLSEDEQQFLTVFLMNGQALVRVRQRRPGDAVDLCRAGLARLDRHLDAGQHRLHRSVLYYNIAQVYAQVGPDDLAVEYFGRTIELDPNYSEYYNDRGTVSFKMGRFEAAEQDYFDAIRLSPPYAEVHINLGQCYRAMGRMDDAAAAYSRALDLEPGSSLALAGRAEALATLGRDEDALADYDDALRIEPAQPLVLASRAILRYEGGRVWEALEDLDQAVALAPELGELRQNRAIALLDVGRTDAAVDDLRSYLELCPEAADRLEVEDQISSLLVSTSFVSTAG